MDSNMMMTLVMLGAMALVLFFMFRSENKRKKEENKMRAELAVGDIITTVGGIVGTICAVKENTIVIESGADRVRVEFIKGAVASKGSPNAEK